MIGVGGLFCGDFVSQRSLRTVLKHEDFCSFKKPRLRGGQAPRGAPKARTQELLRAERCVRVFSPKELSRQEPLGRGLQRGAVLGGC